MRRNSTSNRYSAGANTGHSFPRSLSCAAAAAAAAAVAAAPRRRRIPPVACESPKCKAARIITVIRARHYYSWAFILLLHRLHLVVLAN